MAPQAQQALAQVSLQPQQQALQLLALVQEFLQQVREQQELPQAPERNPKRSSLRELRVPLPAPQHQLALLQFLEQLLFWQQPSSQEPSFQ